MKNRNEDSVEKIIIQLFSVFFNKSLIIRVNDPKVHRPGTFIILY